MKGIDGKQKAMKMFSAGKYGEGAIYLQAQTVGMYPWQLLRENKLLQKCSVLQKDKTEIKLMDERVKTNPFLFQQQKNIFAGQHLFAQNMFVFKLCCFQDALTIKTQV